MVEQQGQQDDVIDSKKNYSKVKLELVLNEVYFPALSLLRKSCYKGLSTTGMQQAAANFISAWIDLDCLARANMNEGEQAKLTNIDGIVLTFFDSSVSRDYQQLMQIGMEYADMLKDSGLFNLTLERNVMMACRIRPPTQLLGGE